MPNAVSNLWLRKTPFFVLDGGGFPTKPKGGQKQHHLIVQQKNLVIPQIGSQLVTSRSSHCQTSGRTLPRPWPSPDQRSPLGHWCATWKSRFLFGLCFWIGGFNVVSFWINCVSIDPPGYFHYKIEYLRVPNAFSFMGGIFSNFLCFPDFYWLTLEASNYIVSLFGLDRPWVFWFYRWISLQNLKLQILYFSKYQLIL